MTQSHTLLIQIYFVTDNICMANKWLFLLKNTYKTEKYRHIHKIQKISDHSASKILMSSFWKGQYTSFAEWTHILTYMHTFYLIYTCEIYNKFMKFWLLFFLYFRSSFQQLHPTAWYHIWSAGKTPTSICKI